MYLWQDWGDSDCLVKAARQHLAEVDGFVAGPLVDPQDLRRLAALRRAEQQAEGMLRRIRELECALRQVIIEGKKAAIVVPHSLPCRCPESRKVVQQCGEYAC